MTSPNQKYQTFLDQNPWATPDVLTKSLMRVAQQNANGKIRRAQIIKIANELTDALAPFVACRAGCSQCCHMNTVIYEHEALRLAQVSGRKVAKLRYRHPAVAVQDGMRFNGKACPFLIENQCSVYQDRPLVCRAHHSLNDNADDCDPSISGLRARVVQFDPDIVEIPYRIASEASFAKEPWGNIGEFFPD